MLAHKGVLVVAKSGFLKQEDISKYKCKQCNLNILKAEHPKGNSQRALLIKEEV